jgi:hypothetical protein
MPLISPEGFQSVSPFTEKPKPGWLIERCSRSSVRCDGIFIWLTDWGGSNPLAPPTLRPGRAGDVRCKPICCFISCGTRNPPAAAAADLERPAQAET